ncbi:MAG: hypothetical protein HON29_00430, partial [Candidatus Magasanikbacteria bacterium]|nr:hypothetical protein [Candidatus Magasanikbacteria bacterium]
MIPYTHVFCSFSQLKERRGMQTYQTHTGLSPAGIFIDKCYILENLINQAQNLYHLPFDQKLSRLVVLCSKVMDNAHEQQSALEHDPWNHLFNGTKKKGIDRWEQESAAQRYNFLKDIIKNSPRLSYVLQQKVGSDAHHAVLFFILGFHAKLGSAQFIQFSERP